MAILINKATFGWLFFASFSLHASIVKNEVTALKVHSYPLVDVCKEMNGKHAELISGHSMNEIDCMGKVTSGLNFCLKKHPDDVRFLRAEVMEQTKNLFCNFGDGVTLALNCEGKHLKFCLDSKKSCEELKKLYAYKLEVVHHSISDKTLNCHFAKPIGESIEDL